MNELWADVIGYEKYYQVSNLGQIKSKDRRVNSSFGKTRVIKGRLLKTPTDKAGYPRIDLCGGTKKRNNQYVHRLVAEHFIENSNQYPEVNHIDGVKSNNDFINLEWCTHHQNMSHAFKNGLVKNAGKQRGQKCSASKLTNNQVIEIKNRLKNKETHASIANDFPVGKSAISEINAGRSWGHIHAA